MPPFQLTTTTDRSGFTAAIIGRGIPGFGSVRDRIGSVAEESANQTAPEVTASEGVETGATAPVDRAEEYLRLAQRAQADLANYRRRVEQERDELRAQIRNDTLLSLLPILDDFERATAAIPAEARDLPWVQGMLLIERNLRGVLERAGFERIEALGKTFDPWEHEAIMADETGNEVDETVTAVFRPGYRVNGRVVRPAQVTVARRLA